MPKLNVKQIPDIPVSKIIDFEEEVAHIAGDGLSIQNQNPDPEAINPLYHWQGTLQEYIEQDIEHEHPEWICFITDDSTGIDTIQYPKNDATNCLLEVPQDIKVEINSNHQVVLKAGSVVYIPDGFESDGVTRKFIKYTVTEDIVKQDTASLNKPMDLFFQSSNSYILAGVSDSGTSTVISSKTYYRLNENHIYYRNDSIALQSFPFCRVKYVNGNAIKIEKIYNGFGVVGSTLFALPGVKGLIPDGLDNNGTLKNYMFNINSIKLITTLGGSNFDLTFFVNENNELDWVNSNYYKEGGERNKIFDVFNNAIWYDTDTNYMYDTVDCGINWNITHICKCGTIHVDYDGKLFLTDSKKSFEAVDKNSLVVQPTNMSSDSKNISNWSDNISNCVCEIPQDIKLELNNGVITLKAGSVVYIPNGKFSNSTRKFDRVVISEDVSYAIQQYGGWQDELVLYYKTDGELQYRFRRESFASASTEVPTYYQNSIWYNTTDNVIKDTRDNGTTWSDYNISLPLAMCSAMESTTSGTGVFIKIDQVFNGVGYFANCVYVLPGVSGLAPNGFNDDKTLKSNKIVVNEVLLEQTNSYTTSNMPIVVGNYNNALDINVQNYYYNQEEEPVMEWCFWYKHSENKLYFKQGSGFPAYPNFEQYNGFLVGYLDRENGRFVRFSSRPAIELVNASDFYDYKEYSVDEKNITDCVSSIPQNIKVELNEGVITLKAGSIIYIPNGFETDGTTRKFNKHVIREDITQSTPAIERSRTFLVLNSSRDTILPYLPVDTFASPTQPTIPNQYAIWYDLTNNLIKTTNDTGTTWNPYNSLPFALASSTASVWTQVNQIFCGFGFMGTASFVLPDVKGLVPNGRNPDRTLRNNEITVNNVLLNSGYSGSTPRNSNDYLFLGASSLSTVWEEDYFIDYYPPVSSTDWALVYDSGNNNYHMTSYGNPYTTVQVINTHCKCYRDKSTGKITSMRMPNPIKVLNYYDREFIAHQAFPSNQSWIDLGQPSNNLSINPPTDGWVALKLGNCSIDTSIAFDNYEMCVIDKAKDAGNILSIFIPVKRNDNVILTLYTTSYELIYFRFIYAVGTQ